MQDGSIFWAPTYLRNDMEKSPLRDQMTIEKEHQLRNRLGHFIFKTGRDLNFPYQAIATACVYMHHFYMCFHYSEKDRYIVCYACLFLASKTEECRKTISDIIRAMFLFRRKKPPPKTSETFKEMQNRVFREESKVLQAIDFSFQLNHPYQFIFPALENIFWKELNKSSNKQEIMDKIKKLAKLSWWFVNDSFRTTVCLFYPPQHIAIAAIDLAFRYYNGEQEANRKIEDQLFLSDMWWSMFDPAVSKSLLDNITVQILKVFNDKQKTLTRDCLMKQSAVYNPSENAKESIVNSKNGKGETSQSMTSQSVKKNGTSSNVFTPKRSFYSSQSGPMFPSNNKRLRLNSQAACSDAPNPTKMYPNIPLGFDMGPPQGFYQPFYPNMPHQPPNYPFRQQHPNLGNHPPQTVMNPPPSRLRPDSAAPIDLNFLSRMY